MEVAKKAVLPAAAGGGRHLGGQFHRCHPSHDRCPSERRGAEAGRPDTGKAVLQMALAAQISAKDGCEVDPESVP